MKMKSLTHTNLNFMERIKNLMHIIQNFKESFRIYYKISKIRCTYRFPFRIYYKNATINNTAIRFCKLSVEKTGAEAWGWKVRGWNILQPLENCHQYRYQHRLDCHNPHKHLHQYIFEGLWHSFLFWFLLDSVKLSKKLFLSSFFWKYVKL